AFDFIANFDQDPLESPLVCVVVETTKGVSDGSRTTYHGRGQVPMGVFRSAAQRLWHRPEVLSTPRCSVLTMPPLLRFLYDQGIPCETRIIRVSLYVSIGCWVEGRTQSQALAMRQPIR